MWRNQRFSNESEVANLPLRIASSEKLLIALTTDAGAASPVLATDLSAKIHGRVYRGRDDLGEALRTAVRSGRASVAARSTEELVGEVGQFRLVLFIGRQVDEVHLYLQGEATHDCNPYQTGPALYSDLLSVLQGMEMRRSDAARKLASLNQRLTNLREELAKPFEHQKRLTALMVRQRELARELDLDRDEAGTQVIDDASEEPLAA